jgi:hypothetical protein
VRFRPSPHPRLVAEMLSAAYRVVIPEGRVRISPVTPSLTSSMVERLTSNQWIGVRFPGEALGG